MGFISKPIRMFIKQVFKGQLSNWAYTQSLMGFHTAISTIISRCLTIAEQRNLRKLLFCLSTNQILAVCLQWPY